MSAFKENSILRLFLFSGLMFVATIVSCWAGELRDSPGAKIRRFAFVVGKNEGGRGRTPLKYAASDAQAFTKVMEELGGLDGHDAILLLNPNRRDFLARFQDVQSIVQKSKSKDTRTELFLYYSGHSDDEGLLLDGDRVTYRELKKEIARISADLSVVILDSCASGSLTRVKGGMKRLPFLEDSLSKLKGYVVLTSSSAQEASQESDRVKGSFFTHYLVSGVRGAADVNADNRVTLNEAYQYAFNQTLARTEKTLAGPQHPSYNIELAGSGELVMTDIRNTNSRIVFEDKLLGRFYIRSQDERLVAEVEKHVPKAVSVGLEPGTYGVTSFFGGKIASATAKIGPNQALRLAISDFRPLEAEANALRGDAVELESFADEDYVTIPAEFSVLPGVSSNVLDQDRTINHFHLSLFNSRSAKLKGAEISLLGFNRVGKSVAGLQLAPGANLIDSGPLTGAQLSAGYNLTSEVTGAQISTGYNSAGKVTGAQVGGYNRALGLFGLQAGGASVADSVTGLQAGGANFSRTSVTGAQIGAVNLAPAVKGAQIGAVNVAEGTKGVQLGVVNIADEMGGLQLGVFNKSRGRGAVPIGLINVVEDGMYRLGYAYGEKGFHQIQFRNGSENAYSIFQYGHRFADDANNEYNLFGFGFGTQFTAQKFYLGIEGGINYVNHSNFTFDGEWTAQLRLLPGFRITRAISLSAGPTFNYAFVFPPSDPFSFAPPDLYPPEVYSKNRVWIGYHVGVEIWL